MPLGERYGSITEKKESEPKALEFSRFLLALKLRIILTLDSGTFLRKKTENEILSWIFCFIS